MTARADPCDVLIVGAGVMGASLARWLARLRPAWRILLIERDPQFARASSSLSASSIRQQFSCAVNVALSRFGIDFLRGVDRELPGLHGINPLSLHEGGYLYLANQAQRAALAAAHTIQRSLGAEVALLEPAEIAGRFPWLHLDDVVAGSLGLTGEGWFDGPALHQALLADASARGVGRVSGEVTGLIIEPVSRAGADRRVSGVRLASGEVIHAAQVVNAAGPWSARVAAMAGSALDVVASRRTVFVLSCPTPLPDCPLLIDPSGFWIRPEGSLLLYGAPPIDERPDLPLEPDWNELDESAWTRLAWRIPALEAMRIERAWAGYYEMHRFDHNGVIGPDPGIDGFWHLCGFSGHGLQHAPGAGLALAEWLCLGEPQTIDVRPLSPERIARAEPLLELNVIG
jgi:glycine/D-amino acid oxidase-like deaminating enzyme